VKALILSDRVPVVPDALIFLDIDGVLNNHVPFSSGWCGTGSVAVERLNQLLAFRPSAGVVLVSSWRYFVLSGCMTLEGLESLLMTHGLDIRGRLVGVMDADEALRADWRCMVMWAGFRNPLNALSRLVIGVDVSRCVIDKVWGDDQVIEEPGQGGKQYLIARRDDGKTFPRLFIVLPYWFDPTHAVLIDIGWKIKLSHNGTPKDARLADRAKGIVFTLSPWKTLV
jgi:hypothetical protein